MTENINSEQHQQQMPCWYYERDEIYKTPSFYDKIDHEMEAKQRREGARFLFDVTAACCLMLAGKVEETPKKVRDIVKTARSLLSNNDFEQFGSDPREEVMAYERVLLKTIKFDLQVSHPYSYLLQFVKRIKGNQEKLKELVQMSWSFINDSLATTLCLQWEPEIVACAVLYLATRMSKYTIEDWEGRQPGLRWWECFVQGMSNEVMEDICHKILDLYPSEHGNRAATASSNVQSSTKPTRSGPSLNGQLFGVRSNSQDHYSAFPSSKRPKYDQLDNLTYTNPTAPIPPASMLPTTRSSYL